MLRAIPAATVVLICFILGGVVVLQRHQLVVERARAVELGLAAENAVAERDSTRRVAGVLGDSLSVFEQRAVQVAQWNDVLDDALGRERRAAFAMNVVIYSLRQTAVAVVSDDSVRRATFEIRQAPYTVKADVVVPQPPDSAGIAVRVVLDTILVGARLGCGAPDAHGVRAASIVAVAPAWASVRFGRVEQAAEVCQSIVPPRAAGHRLVFRPLSIGVGRAAVWGGSTGWALFAGAVISWR